MTAVLHTWRRSYTFVCLATVLIVAAADFFFYGHKVGWTAAAMVAAMFCLLSARDTRFYGTVVGRAFTLGLIGLLFALVEQPTWLNATYALLCLSGMALINTMGPESDFVPWLGRWTRWLSLGWTRFFLDNSVAMRWLMRRGFSPAVARTVAAWTVPVLLSLVFVGIFAWANPIIDNWISALGHQIAEVLKKLPSLLDIPRMFFWLAFAVAAWMLLRGRVWRRHRRAPPNSQRPFDAIVIENEFSISAALVIRCLILFNIVFAVENILDLSVLYSEHTPTGTEYKTYVRRGAYPLVAAALLAGTFVLVTFRPDSDTEKSPAARHLVYVWVGQTILLTGSAIWRLHRYIDLTELTRLRVASAVWFLLVALGLFYIVWRIVKSRSNAWLINANALTALLVIYPCCFINFDGYIADFNAEHCREAGGPGSAIDLDYFRDLGPSALAALDRTRGKLTVRPRAEHAAEVSRDLHAQLNEELADWRSWTWRRQRAQREVEAVAAAKGVQERDLASAGPTIAH